MADPSATKWSFAAVSHSFLRPSPFLRGALMPAFAKIQTEWVEKPMLYVTMENVIGRDDFGSPTEVAVNLR